MIYEILRREDLRALDPFLERIGVTSLNRERAVWDWTIKKIQSGEKNALITVERDDQAITSAAICYSADSMLETTKPILPYWILGLTRSWSTTPISARHNSMFMPAVQHFENQGMTSFFMSRLVLKSVTYENAESHFSRSQLRIGIDRYDSRLELLLNHPSELDVQPLLYNIVAHSKWDPSRQKMAIIRQDLKFIERAKLTAA